MIIPDIWSMSGRWRWRATGACSTSTGMNLACLGRLTAIAFGPLIRPMLKKLVKFYTGAFALDETRLIGLGSTRPSDRINSTFWKTNSAFTDDPLNLLREKTNFAFFGGPTRFAKCHVPLCLPFSSKQTETLQNSRRSPKKANLVK